MMNIPSVYLTGIFIAKICKEYLLLLYIVNLCDVTFFSRYDTSWIHSYSMWEGCQPYIPEARIFMAITLALERSMVSGPILTTRWSTELTLCRNTV